MKKTIHLHQTARSTGGLLTTKQQQYEKQPIHS
jgi:hypothetical protein